MQIQITPAQFEAARQRVYAATGEEIAGASGTLAHSGIEASYEYDGDILSIAIRRKPFYVSTTFIEDQITAWFAGS